METFYTILVPVLSITLIFILIKGAAGKKTTELSHKKRMIMVYGHYFVIAVSFLGIVWSAKYVQLFGIGIITGIFSLLLMIAGIKGLIELK